MEIKIKGGGLWIIDKENEIFIGAVDGDRFTRLFNILKRMNAEYQIKKLNKKCPYCS